MNYSRCYVVFMTSGDANEFVIYALKYLLLNVRASPKEIWQVFVL